MAIFLASGEAKILPSFTTDAVGATVAATTGGAVGAGVAFDASTTGAATAGLSDEVFTDFTIASISKPGWPMMHNN